MADTGNADGGRRRQRHFRSLVLAAVALGVLAAFTFPAVVDTDTLGQTAISVVSVACAVLLGRQAARVRREPG